MLNDEFEPRTIYANGHRIHVKIAGTSGPLVLFCHGFPESWYSWRHQLRALAAAGYRGVAMDMRGYGRSGKPVEASEYRITNLIGDCIAVVEAMGEKQAVIVGHDLGAPVAWTAAWTRPDIFRAVAALSVPFSGSGFAAFPGSPFGELSPSAVQKQIAGPDRIFYSEYFCLPGDVAAREAELDVRTWLTSAMYALSAEPPLPPELQGVDLLKLPRDALQTFVREVMSVPRDGDIAAMLKAHGQQPSWLSAADLDFGIAELEYSGLAAPMKNYRNGEIDWETLQQYGDAPVTVPALFIGGDRDINTIWGQEAIARAHERVPHLRDVVIIANCGHWIQQEHPEQVNTALLEFLKSL
ncbi:MAG TPA: alpha/beta hydrolase [Sphingobium sp.]